MKISEYYVYIFRHPDTNIPFYVGKGKESRYLYHFREVKNNYKARRNTNKNKRLMLSEIFDSGKNPIVEIITATSEIDALEMEELLIKTIGRINNGTGPLTNMIDNIQGRMEHIPNSTWKKCGRDMRGVNNPRYGKKMSQETKDKISKAQKQKVLEGKFIGTAGRKITETEREHFRTIRAGRYFKPKHFIDEKFETYKEFVYLYLSRPNLVGVVEDYCPKSGNYVTYKRQFCKNYCLRYAMTSNGMHNILSGKSKTYNEMFMEIGIDLCNI